MIKWISMICFIGSLLAFSLGTLGLFKFPDPYTRMHAISIGDTLGVGFMGIGLLLLSPNWILRIKLISILIFFWIINPTMTHLIAKAAVMYGIEPADTSIRKE